MTETCETCRFRIQNALSDVYECHRHAPVVAEQKPNAVFLVIATWPYVWPYMWCGEYERKVD